jgi:rare lipoprotein A
MEPRRVPTDNPSAATKPPAKEPSTPQEDELSLPAGARPIFVETGVASWYGPPYHNRRGSNGEIYNMNAMTAAHRTLPLGSIVRVTNLKTGQAALVRITDRGPFVQGRILDLSLAAAKKLDVWQAGIAKVKVEVMQTPTPLETGGRWAVQIGSFTGQRNAEELAKHLSRRYHTAQVAAFASPTGDWWLRVRVLNDDRHRAEELASETSTSEGKVFLVRLD